MIRRSIFALFCAAALGSAFNAKPAHAEDAYGRQWSSSYSTQDWDRFYHYPYVYYPQNFYGNEYYRSADDMYYRYPPEMRIPVYNKQWMNYYPSAREYYSGSHFQLDTF